MAGDEADTKSREFCSAPYPEGDKTASLVSFCFFGAVCCFGLTPFGACGNSLCEPLDIFNVPHKPEGVVLWETMEVVAAAPELSRCS